MVNDRVAVHPSVDSISTVNVSRSKSNPVSKILTAVGQPSSSIASIRIDALLSLPTRVYGFSVVSVSLYLFKKYPELLGVDVVYVRPVNVPAVVTIATPASVVSVNQVTFGEVPVTAETL